ncbi:hypothetical protein [Cysteiniphilum sp. 6C5]|uniref:hypothetical protein n=1 Tax=unclassified Cysteiniphilum TaxID=2610889 RepID=UPI003F855FD1
MNPTDYSLSDYALIPLPDALVIIDLNRGGKSVTNNIENVVTEISYEIPELFTLDIVYRDSEKLFDGIWVDKQNQFVSFELFRTNTFYDALLRMKKLKSNKQEQDKEQEKC